MRVALTRNGDSSADPAAGQRPSPNSRAPRYTLTGNAASSTSSVHRNAAPGPITFPSDPVIIAGRLW